MEEISELRARLFMTNPNFEPVNFGAIRHERIKVRPMYYELGFSPYPEVYGRRIVLEKILSALENIPKKYGVTIWDVYRPRAVQNILFDRMRCTIKKMNPALTDEQNLIETQKYIAPPSQVGDAYCPPHLSGGAVDLTLHDCATGKELDMGTEFDDCTQRAHRDYFEKINDLDKQSRQIREHRRTLKCAMESADFRSYQHEWWHFDYGNILWQKATGRQALFGPLFNDLEWPLDARSMK